jgi:predicted TIM-barrel fold metal-dependent hydrolase
MSGELAIGEYSGPIIDCSVHNEAAQLTDLFGYLSPQRREYAERWTDARGLEALLAPEYRPLSPIEDPDAQPGDGAPAAADPQRLSKALSGARIILNHGRLLSLSGLAHWELADALARAANDWLVERWLSADERFAGSIMVANQVPEQAAREIRRMAKEPRMVQVAMCANGIGHAFGHPLFDPIYEGAVECGLPVAIHAGAHGGVNPSPTGGGRVSFYIEHEVLSLQVLMTALASLIAGGALERFPELKIIFQGGGVAWVPGFLWRYEADYMGVHREIPWARHRPLEYFRSNIRVSTESLEYAAGDGQLINALADVGAEETLLYSSDYPRIRWRQAATEIAARFPAPWLAGIFCQNALTTFPRLTL